MFNFNLIIYNKNKIILYLLNYIIFKHDKTQKSQIKIN